MVPDTIFRLDHVLLVPKAELYKGVIAEVLDRSGNPPSLCGVQHLASLSLIVALCLHSARFVRPANTVLTLNMSCLFAPGRRGEWLALVWAGGGRWL